MPTIFNGADSFHQLAVFLGRAEGTSSAMVGFQLANTLSENGAVSRGLCDVAADGALRGVTEQTGILPAEVGEGKPFAGTAIVSMNCWGFSPEIFAKLDERFSRLPRSGTRGNTGEGGILSSRSGFGPHRLRGDRREGASDL